MLIALAHAARFHHTHLDLPAATLAAALLAAAVVAYLNRKIG